MEDFNTPILFLVFNRPDKTKLVFETIRKAKPKQLFLAADGPRTYRFNERKICENVRKIATNIDWDCEVKTLFREENLGCGKAVSEAITWFFENVEQGIILEDDCIPDPSFFRYCEVLLEKYKHNPMIMHIGANNFQDGINSSDDDYYFSKYNHIWGWATWRRAWFAYDIRMKGFNKHSISKKIKKISENPEFADFWINIFEKCFNEEPVTWDYQWTYTVWNNDGLAISPQVNLISNIGFDEDATHTTVQESWLSNLKTEALNVKTHPNVISVNKVADEFTSKKVFGINGHNYSQEFDIQKAKTIFFHIGEILSPFVPEKLKSYYKRHKYKNARK